MIRATLLLTAFLAATPVYAGGPVITEDAYEAEPQRHDRKIGGLVVGILVIAAIAALANGGGNCTGPEDPVEPTPGPVGGC
jgi:hypothetical protein